MPIQEALDRLEARLEKLESFANSQSSAVAVLCGHLAANLIREGLLDRERLIRALEASPVGEGVDNSAIDQFVKLLKATRPWGVVKGGKQGSDGDDQGPGAA